MTGSDWKFAHSVRSSVAVNENSGSVEIAAPPAVCDHFVKTNPGFGVAPTVTVAPYR
ncbi:MAG: hypothetical protein BWX70_03514 [Verrucomicrobia bacterium ADurb.Bin070]|nr:MAG: hypothetical protein BWX70_03514 [Verrucomicrobia bacterium ADurb.Bin070]